MEGSCMKDDAKMKYPFFTYRADIKVMPLFKNLEGNPFVLDLSEGSDVFNQVDVLNQSALQFYLDEQMKDSFTWGLAGYLENRCRVLSNYPQMVKEKTVFSPGN
jgi:hypothetical protein